MSDTDERPRARRQQNRLLIIALVMNAVLLPPVYLILFNVFSDEPRDNLWAFVGLMSGAGVLFALLLAGLLVWARRSGTRWAQPQLVVAVDQERRKRIIQAVRKGEPVDARDHEVAADVAYWFTRQRLLVWFVLLVALPVAVAALVVGGPNLVDVGSSVVVGVLLIWAPFALRNARCGRAWLDRHEESGRNR